MTMTSNKIFLTNANSGEQNIVFIDRQVSDYQSLVASIKPQTKVVLLDSEEDGIEEMTKYLQGGKYKSVHVVSHGSAGSLQLGSSQLNSGNLDTYKSQLQQWKTVLTEDADILLYGCDVAEGEIGVSFVQQLSQLTGADVAASDDLTGNASLGGDWELEVSAGMIEAPLAFQAGVIEAYNSVLATTISTPVVTINNPSPAVGELFGFSMASSSSSILIGAPKSDGNKGEAYRFGINGSFQQTFTNPSSGTGEQFGFAVATDGTNYLISASKWDGAVQDVGIAYRFDDSGTKKETFNNSVNSDDSEFGSAITILSNGNYVIGAPERGKNTPTDNAGQVRLFNSNGTLLKDITNPETTIIQDARFGFSVAAAVNNIFIGSPGFTSGSNFITEVGTGKAYLYNTTSNSFQNFNNPNASSQDLFGFSVASNSNGTRFLVGAPRENIGGTAGIAYLFDNNSNLLRTFTNPDTTNQGFGASVAFVGNDILISSPGGFTFDLITGTFVPTPNRGGVYLYDGDGTTPTYNLDRIFTNPNTGTDGFGAAISVLDNNTIAISAPYYDQGSNTDAGIAYIFNLSRPPVVQANKTITLNEDTSNTALDITAPTDADGDIFTITVTGLSDASKGKVYLADGTTEVTNNQELTASQLTGLVFRPVADANGSAGSFSYSVNDARASSSQSITFNINSVNDRPTFTKGGNQSVKAGMAQTIAGWASSFNSGAANEIQNVAGYTIEIVNSVNADIFEVAPTINLAGELSYTAKSGITTSKTATIEVKVQDDGGTNNGGVNTSVAQTFTITVNPTSTNSINATPNPDTLTGTDQSDRISVLDDNDIVYGGLASDRIFGGNGGDILYGDLGVNPDNSDIIPAYGLTFSMNDTIGGGAGNDKIYGNLDDDKLYGDDGNDQIWGGNGDDEIWGGAGDDILNGGLGKNTFVLVRGHGKDTISDFKVNEDKIAGAGGIKTFGSLLITQLGTDTLITDKARNQDLAVLTGIEANSVNNSHFLAF